MNDFIEKLKGMNVFQRRAAIVRFLEQHGVSVSGTGYRAPSTFSLTVDGKKHYFNPANDEEVESLLQTLLGEAQSAEEHSKPEPKPEPIEEDDKPEPKPEPVEKDGEPTDQPKRGRKRGRKDE